MSDPKWDDAAYWRDQFQLAFAGLSWAVGRLGEDPGYAGVVHDLLTHPVIELPVRENSSDRSGTVPVSRPEV